jgi:hypothetical protein
MKYDIKRATVGRETRAVKATDEPMLMSASRAQMKATRNSAGSGIWRVG